MSEEDLPQQGNEIHQQEILPPVLAPPQDLGHRPYLMEEAGPGYEHLSKKQQEINRKIGKFAVATCVEIASNTKDLTIWTAGKSVEAGIFAADKIQSGAEKAGQARRRAAKEIKSRTIEQKDRIKTRATELKDRAKNIGASKKRKNPGTSEEKNHFPNREDIWDLVNIGKGKDPTFHRSDGKMLSNYELDLIRENQDLIRKNLPERPIVDDQSTGRLIVGNFGRTNNETTLAQSSDQVAEVFDIAGKKEENDGNNNDALDDLSGLHPEVVKFLQSQGISQFAAGVPPNGGARAAARTARKAQNMKNFLSTTPESQTISLERANYLQMRIQHTLIGIQNHKANSISLENMLNSHASEFTRIILSEASEDASEMFKISEGGLRLLQRGLIAGEVPDKDSLERFGKFMEEQNIVNVLNVPGIPPKPEYTTNPRYLKDGEPGFGPYSSQDEDTVASVFALADPKNWKLSPDDRNYLIDVLRTDELEKYQNKPAPTGRKYFWNRDPFKIPLNFYIKKEIANAKQIFRSGQTTEEVRQARMSDPRVIADIDNSTTITDWWAQAVGRSYLSNSTIDKTNKDQIMLEDIKKYARARLDLDRTLT